MITAKDYLQVGRKVSVRMGSTWSAGTVLENHRNDLVVEVNGDRIHIHSSVIRRDVRKRAADRCWISRAEFLTAVGVVNATVEQVRTRRPVRHEVRRRRGPHRIDGARNQCSSAAH